MAESKTTQPAYGAKQDVVVQGKPLEDTKGMISVTYNPGPGDPQESEIFGKKVKAGEAVEVPAMHADKVRGNPYLSLKGEKTYGDDKAKDQKPEEIEDVDFEDEVARERSAEYLEGRSNFGNLPPGEAERIARAQQAAAELKAARESDDTDKPRRGRPPGK